MMPKMPASEVRLHAASGKLFDALSLQFHRAVQPITHRCHADAAQIQVECPLYELLKQPEDGEAAAARGASGSALVQVVAA